MPLYRIVDIEDGYGWLQGSEESLREQVERGLARPATRSERIWHYAFMDSFSAVEVGGLLFLCAIGVHYSIAPIFAPFLVFGLLLAVGFIRGLTQPW